MSKKHLFAKGLVAALESEELAAAMAEDSAPAEIMPESDTMAATMAEVVEAEGEVDAIDASIEEAVEGAEQLEEIAEIAEGSLDNGGMDETSAELLQAHVESIYDRIGVVKTGKMSLESFGTKGTRVQSTKLAIEGMKETAKAVWEKIIAAITTMWNSVSTWFAKLFDANARMAGRAKKIGAAAAEAKGKTAAEAEVSGGFIKKLAVSGEFDPKSVAGGLVSIRDILTKNAQETLVVVKAVAAAKTSETIAAAAMAPEMKSVFSEEDTRGAKTKRLLGDKAVFLNGSKVIVDSFDTTAAEVKAEKVATAEQGEIAEIAKQATTVATAVAENKKLVDEAAKAMKAFTDTIKKFAANTTDETAASMKKAQAAAPKASAMISSLVTKLNGVAVSTTGAALDYAEKSLAQYK